MLYVDLRALLQQSDGVLLVMFQTASHEWQDDGFDFDLAHVPRLSSLAPHLGGELTVLEATDGGCLITRRGSLPAFDLVMVTFGVTCALVAE
jgi:hypothetical protein